VSEGYFFSATVIERDLMNGQSKNNETADGFQLVSHHYAKNQYWIFRA